MRRVSPGETTYDRWVYESIVDAIPGVEFSRAQALAIQLVLFEVGVLGLAAVFDAWAAVPAGTAAVVVVSSGSALMLTLGRRIRDVDVPRVYTDVLFGTQIEIVLGVFSFVGLITYLFVVDPQTVGSSLLGDLLGRPYRAPVVAFTLVVLFDVCYRIGTGWWASIVGLWRTVMYGRDLATESRSALLRADLVTIGFAWVQTIMLPFVAGHDLIFFAVAGHVLAVTLVSGASVLLLSRHNRADSGLL
ncbi:hypothetical protein GJ629_10215 [Halapricum sp. CBA1109]|uniref:DUF7530 family protein n=1 Tax=Halapricum sp. CBA1109 TaxID=2668068 RepID=UPI0013BE2DE6|nr:hypothetical protein [Halapricum sp. CBA1109]MUV90216.1 hypothetical protein [Halapricum sp. CBA1109]